MPGGPIDPEAVMDAIQSTANPATWSSDHIIVSAGGGATTYALAIVGNAWALDVLGGYLIDEPTFDEIARANTCANGILHIGGDRYQLAAVNGYAVLRAP